MRRGGLVVRGPSGLSFVPAEIASRLLPIPRYTRVPGAPPELLGVAVLEGAIIPVVTVGPPPQPTVAPPVPTVVTGVAITVPGTWIHVRGAMLVCLVQGDTVGLVGLEVLQAGVFDAAPESSGVTLEDGTVAKALDVAGLLAAIRGRSTHRLS